MPQQIEYNPDKDYYSILGIRPDSSLEEIKMVWRKKAFELHPDRNQSSDREIKDINEAYSILKEPDKRKVYDRKRAMFIAKTFKFKNSFYKTCRVPKHYFSDIETQLKSDSATPWYRHNILKTISSKILKKKVK